jgi:IS605 OrfB family transposase
MLKVNKSYSFYSNNLNKVKYDLLYNKALVLREFKNNISKTVITNPSKFFNLSKFDWINYFRTNLSYCNNQDISNAITDVYTAYENKRIKFNTKIKFKVQDKVNISYYKKNTIKNKKGNVKSFNIIFKETKLSKILSYISKYYHSDFIEFLEKNKEHNKLREDALFYIKKYGNRLINLAILKQKNTIKKMNSNVIEFVSLTFTSCTEQKQNIINRNKNKESIFNCIISLSGQDREKGKLHIPVKYSRNHHGDLKDFYKEYNKKGQRVISYKVSFEKNRVRIILTRLGKDDTVINKKEYYGIDVNVKHNLFSDKYGNFIDYDRDLFNDYIKFLTKLDRKKKIKNTNKLSNKDIIVFNKWKTRIKDMLKRKCNILIKQAIKNNKNHIIMEDLQHMGKTFARNDEFNGFKYSRLIRLLNLTDLKNIIKSIANKHNLQVTFIQPHYTSKACDNCGHIHDENRVTQEIFECKACGHTSNADTHSAKMIEDRLHLDVLRKSLLTYQDGLYHPKKLTKDSIKNILTECYDINNKNYC